MGITRPKQQSHKFQYFFGRERWASIHWQGDRRAALKVGPWVRSIGRLLLPSLARAAPPHGSKAPLFLKAWPFQQALCQDEGRGRAPSSLSALWLSLSKAAALITRGGGGGRGCELFPKRAPCCFPGKHRGKRHLGQRGSCVLLAAGPQSFFGGGGSHKNGKSSPDGPDPSLGSPGTRGVGGMPWGRAHWGLTSLRPLQSPRTASDATWARRGCWKR